MSEIGAPTKRYNAYTGFITTPRYFDDSPQQFLSVAPEGTGVIQRVMHIPNYEYELSQRARNFDLLTEAAICTAPVRRRTTSDASATRSHGAPAPAF